MIHRKSGKLVFVSSVAGLVPIPYRSAYAASKHALQAFCDSLRAEIAAYNVQVLVSSPEYIAIDLTKNEVNQAGTQDEGMSNATINQTNEKKKTKLISILNNCIKLFLQKILNWKRRSNEKLCLLLIYYEFFSPYISFLSLSFVFHSFLQ